MGQLRNSPAILFLFRFSDSFLFHVHRSDNAATDNFNGFKRNRTEYFLIVRCVRLLFLWFSPAYSICMSTTVAKLHETQQSLLRPNRRTENMCCVSYIVVQVRNTTNYYHEMLLHFSCDECHASRYAFSDARNDCSALSSKCSIENHRTANFVRNH